MARPGQVFNSFKRQKLLRKHIPAGEVLAGLLCLLALGVAGVWVALKKDDFDPRERDVSIETLVQDSVQDTLYKTPLKRWRDPALGDAGAPAVDLGPVPPAVLQGGWTAPAGVETFSPDTLYEKVDGQAEQYLKFGFQELNALSLTGPGGLAYDVYLYDQGSFANALGLYQEQRGDKQVQRAGEALFTPTSLGAYGMIGRVFFQLIAGEEGEPARAKTRQLLEALNVLASRAPTPVPFRLLREQLELPLDRVTYEPENVFQFGFAERFWFGAPQAGGTARVFLHQAASPEAARALVEKLKAGLLGEYEREGQDLLRHTYLKTFFAVDQRGALVFGVYDYPDPAAARGAMGRLADLPPVAGAGGEEATEEPGMGEPGAEEPGMGEPGMGEPGMGEPGMGEPGMGEPGEEDQ